MNTEKALRDHVMYLLRGGGAHLTFDQAVAGLPARLRGVRPRGLPHSCWRLVEHLRLAQWDILEFCRNAEHVSPKFPDGYWPKGDAPPNARDWSKSVSGFRADLKAMQKLVENRSTDLFAKIPHGNGQTILREALLIADHNAYHLGQLVVVRRMIGAWKD
jgi:DinB superfamily